MMVWLVCVFPFGVYATVAVHTGRAPHKWPGVVVALFAFTSPLWGGWPVHALHSNGMEVWGLLGVALAWGVLVGALLGACCQSGRFGAITGAVSFVMLGLGVAPYTMVSWWNISFLIAVGLWHFVMGGLLINWLWSLNEKDDIDRDPLCDRCGYDMRGLEHGVCPECGHDHAVAIADP